MERKGAGTYTVPKPVGGGGESDTTGSDWQWENLADDNPGAWTPGGSEEENVDTDECDHGFDGIIVVESCDTHDGDDKFTNQHS